MSKEEYTEIEKMLGVDYTDEELEILKAQAQSDGALFEYPLFQKMFKQALEKAIEDAVKRGIIKKCDEKDNESITDTD